MDSIINRYTPHGWSTRFPAYELIEVPIDQNVLNSWGMKEFTVTKMAKFENSYINAMYKLKKEEYASRGISQTMTLFHATGHASIPSILKENLDYRYVVRAKFGQGVSFSPSVRYANRQCNRRNAYPRAMIVAEVIVGNKMSGYSSSKVPPGNFHTTGDSNGNVYVKYYDHEFLPKYVVTYYQPLGLFGY